MLSLLIHSIINSLRAAIARVLTWFMRRDMITNSQTVPKYQSSDTELNCNQIPLNSSHNPTLYNSIGANSYTYKYESTGSIDTDDDGWNSDSDANDPTLRYQSPIAPQWATPQDYLDSISNLSEFELLNELYLNWLTNKQTPEQMEVILRSLLLLRQDAYAFTITFVNRMKRIKMGRCSPVKLCLSVLEELLQTNSFSLRPILTTAHRLQALEAGVLCQPSVLDELCRIFYIDSLGNEIKCRVMKELITSNQYKEAIMSITRFRLQSFFSVQELLPPLIGTDQINLIEAYIGSDRNLQIQFIMLLDKLCSPNTDYLKLYSYFQSSGFTKSDVTNNKLSEHQIKRLAGRLIKTYELDASLFVHFTTAKVSSFTTSLLYQYYFVKENSRQIHTKNWIDLLTASVELKEELQVHLVEGLVKFRDYRIAKYFVNHFNLSRKIPELTSNLLSNIREFIPAKHGTNDRERNQRYYPLHLSFDNIQMIDTPSKLQKCQEYISKKGTVIGIDAEWLMPLCNFGILRLAILQLATKHFVFLLDMVALTGALSESQQVSFIKSLFHTSDTIKLGFAIEGDLKMLGRTWPCVSNLLNTPVSTIDLQLTASKVKSRSNGFTNSPLKSDTDQTCEAQNQTADTQRSAAETMSTQSLFQKTSLTCLIEECFGFPMDKSNQIANWEKRPIRDDMMTYAALDAFCLLELFDYFRSNFGDSIF